MADLWIERMLFIVGDQNTGKSSQLRSMFRDRKFGSWGTIPTSNKVVETVVLGHQRSLYLRITSPHEYGDTLEEFVDKIKLKTGKGRWCFACALQPTAENKMPNLIDTIENLIHEFTPERIRICFLSPDRHGKLIQNHSSFDLDKVLNKLNEFEEIEYYFVDAKNKIGNGLIHSDFFDFS